MENIFTGNIVSPEAVSIPTVQTPLRPDQPVTYGRGESFSVYVKYPVGTKRLLFTINDRTFTTSPPVFQQIVFPNPKEGGIAEFSVDTATTLKFSAGLYYWDIFQLRDDGSKDIWSPYNTGTFSIVEYPSSSYIELQTSTTPVDIYNNPPCPDGRNVTLTALKNDDWFADIKWGSGDNVSDLSGYTAYMPVKTDQFSNTIIIELTTENGRIILDNSSGLITLALTSAQLNTIPNGTYYYYLELTKNNEPTKLIGGNFIVKIV
jgi:hypothetical protein